MEKDSSQRFEDPEMLLGPLGAQELDELLETIVEQAGLLLGTPHGFISLVEPGQDQIEARVGTGFFEKLVGSRIERDVGLAGRVIRTGAPFTVDDYSSWPGRRRDLGAEPVYALAGVPLRCGPRVTGVISLAYMEEGHLFGDEEMEVLGRFADLASVALNNARLHALARRELSERERTEQALAEERNLLRTLIDTLPDHIYVKDPEGRTIVSNAARARDLGVESPEELVGRTDFDLYERALAEAYDADDQDVIVSGQPLLNKMEPSVDARGNERWHSTTKVPLRDRNGKIVGLVGMSRDVTRQKEAEEALGKSEERYRRLVEYSPEPIGVYVDAEIVYMNPAGAELLGAASPGELLGKNILSFVHPEHRELARARLRRVQGGGQVKLREQKLLRLDGQLIYVEVKSIPTTFQGKPAVQALIRDTTERRRAEEALRESEERYRAVVEQTVDGIYLSDADSKRLLEANPAFCRMLGYVSEELRGTHIYDFIAYDRENIDSVCQRVLDVGRLFIGERRYRRKDGSVLDVETSASVISYGDREALCTVVRDITERKALEKELRHQAFHDSLTGLPNRALFLDRLDQTLARASRDGRSAAVLFVDLDNFKVVNDSLGHAAGNRLLAAVAHTLQACVRPGDTVARLSGDEFAILLEGVRDVNEAVKTAERISAKLQRPFSVNHREIFATASIGIDVGTREQSGPEDLLHNADLAMYTAKSMGRARHEVFAPSMNARAIERLDLENDLRAAVERNEFTLHYQPIVSLESGKIEGLEALLRWESPERGLVSPSEFIVVAEQTGLIAPIGQWAVEEVCRQLRKWQTPRPRQGLPTISVNLSTRELLHEPELIVEALQKSGIEPESLRFEITERSVMEHVEFAIGKLEKMRGLGVRFAIDDFGTGYSCLHYLKRLPVDHLKIDRSFIEGLGDSPQDAAIVSGTIALGHALDLTVVAEGVEKAEQVSWLQKMGCDLAQGYYFSRPVPARAARALLEESARQW